MFHPCSKMGGRRWSCPSHRVHGNEASIWAAYLPVSDGDAGSVIPVLVSEEHPLKAVQCDASDLLQEWSPSCSRVY